MSEMQVGQIDQVRWVKDTTGRVRLAVGVGEIQVGHRKFGGRMGGVMEGNAAGQARSAV